MKIVQIYYPKGTIVKEWLCDVPFQAANDMYHHLENRRKPFSIMEFATLMCNYFKANHGFRAPMYPCKNLSRYLAMAHPELIVGDEMVDRFMEFVRATVENVPMGVMCNC